MSARPVAIVPDGLADQRLEALAQALAPSLPCTDRVGLALLELLATGRPVAEAFAIAQRTGALYGTAVRGGSVAR